jgi:hypothetical protein
VADQSILIIRHAEKPEPGGDGGVDAQGQPDPKSLTPRGWQRAGAWVQIFSPALAPDSAPPQPAAIFASAPLKPQEKGDDGSKSRRPLETVTPLAARFGITVDLSFTKGQEATLAATISNVPGAVLVCWQHEDILAIAQALDPSLQGLPAVWPGSRFNVIFQFDRPDAASPWSFRQLAPVMLDGDPSTPL